MRIYILSALLITAASCGNTGQEESTAAQQPGAATTTTMQESTDGPIDPKTKVDPVCSMEWETGWTDYSVYNGDTIRFCGEGCKMAFDARPGKYVTAK